jgi:hypothetical protein
MARLKQSGIGDDSREVFGLAFLASVRSTILRDVSGEGWYGYFLEADR